MSKTYEEESLKMEQKYKNTKHRIYARMTKW